MMDKNIVRILQSHGCGYIVDDHKEMIEEIEAYIIKRESQKQTIKTIMQLDEESGLYDLPSKPPHKKNNKNY